MFGVPGNPRAEGPTYKPFQHRSDHLPTRRPTRPLDQPRPQPPARRRPVRIRIDVKPCRSQLYLFFVPQPTIHQPLTPISSSKTSWRGSYAQPARIKVVKLNQEAARLSAQKRN